MPDQCKIPVLQPYKAPNGVCSMDSPHYTPFQEGSTAIVTLGNGVIYDEKRQLCISTVPFKLNATASTPTSVIPDGISFDIHANKATVSQYSLNLIKEIMNASGNTSILITSTLRNAEDQARAMYANIIAKDGIAKNYALYGAAGDRVVKVAADGIKKKLSKAAILKAMEAEITKIGARKVSRHAGDPSKINVIDISPRSVKYQEAFVREIKKRKIFLLEPPKDPAYHLEIDQ